MPTSEDAGTGQSPTSSRLDRRTVIERSLGLALAGSVLGASTELAAAMSGTGQQSATPPSGIALPQGMRRIVTGHDAEGKSYVVSDERVTGGAFPNLFATSGDNPFGPGPAGESRELRSTDSPRLEPAVGELASYSSPCRRPALTPNWVGTGPRRSISTCCSAASSSLCSTETRSRCIPATR